MGWRLYRRVHIAPGMRLNFGTRGVSASFGHRGAWYTVGPHGRRRATLGWPGTGLSYTTQSGGRSQRTPDSPTSFILGLVFLAVLAFIIFRFAVAVGSAIGD